MNSLAFAAHPSIRIKGTENNFNPIACDIPTCNFKTPHLHCPFCIRSEVYQDPVILKAHFRVKHVDKGIEFAGLKVLRCCDNCDIVGVIKGEKKFKGAHWHCYKCRNGFNRRDEAIKHFKTHFRNPQTTFQIQITQDLNQSVTQYNNENQEASNQLMLENNSIHPALTQAVACISSPLETDQANGKCHDGPLHVTIAANETVESADGQTIMIIREDQLNSQDSSSPYSSQLITESTQNDKTTQLLATKCHQLEEEKQHLKKENEDLKLHIQLLNDELKNYQLRDKENLTRLANSTDQSMQCVIDQLSNDHKDILNQQFMTLKDEFLKTISSKITSTVAQLLTSSHTESILDNTTQKIVEVSSAEELVNVKGQTLEIIEIKAENINHSIENTEVLSEHSIPVSVAEGDLVMCVNNIDHHTDDSTVTDVVDIKIEQIDEGDPPSKRHKAD